jgi:hypothetical protein
MSLKKILFKPGVNRENTRYTNEGGWYESDKIRFRQGTPQKIGGWARISANIFQGICRSLWNWVTLGGQNLIGVGTNLKFYIQNGGQYYDVTPIRKTVTLANPFTTNPATNSGGNTTVVITEVNHGITDNSYVTIYYPGAAPTVGGVLIPTAQYDITYLTNDSYSITLAGTASSIATGGGTVYFAYQVNAGPEYQTPLVGWGAGGWGTPPAYPPPSTVGTWGYGSESTGNPIQIWSQVNYGQNLLYGPRGSQLYYWNAVTGYRNSPITITIASPALLTLTYGIQNGTALTLTTDGYLPSGLVPGTVYYAINATTGIDTSVVVNLQGAFASGQVGTPVAAGIPVTVNLTSVSATGSLGAINLPNTVSILGVSASGAVGNTIAAGIPVTVSITGVSATGSVNYFNLINVTVSNIFTCNLAATYGGAAINTSGSQSGTQYISPRGVPLSSLAGSDGYAPLYQNTMTVSDASRFVIVFGTNDYGSTIIDPMLIRWSDQESLTIWYPAATNQAGSINLSHGSKIVTTLQSRQEILVFTDSTLYSMQYVGPPAIWQTQLLADNISIAGPNAAALASGVTYWMGVDKFYKYDGRLQTLRCDLRQYIFDDINQNQFDQVVASTNEGFNEIWFFYCSFNSNVVNKYVIYNYAEDIWYYGYMGRTAWLDSGLINYPIAATYSYNLVEHEYGLNDATDSDTGVAIQAYINSSQFDIDDGQNFGFIWRLVPDITFRGSTVASPTVTMTLLPLQNSGSGYNNPTSVGGQSYASVSSSGNQAITVGGKAYEIEQFTGQVYTRVRGRQMSFSVYSNQLDATWQLGAPRIDIRPDGRR